MRTTAWVLVGLTVAGVAAQTALLVVAGIPLLSREALDRTFPIIPLAVLVGAVVGALIIARHPRHGIGWLLCVGQAGAAVGLPAQTLVVAARRGLPVPDHVLDVAAWAGALLGASYALTLLAALLLLAPDGRLRTRSRRIVLVLIAGSYALRVVALVIDPPTGPDAPATVLGVTADLGTTLGLVAGAVALLVRLRRARGEERQQLRWIVVAAGALAVTLAVMVGVGVARGAVAPWPFQAAFYLGYLAVPVATGFAVLRYRLYDVDVVIGSTVRLAALAVFVVVGYVTVVVALGRVLGGGGVWPSLAAYVVVALAFQPLRRKIDALADRIVHGRRAAPYDSLAAFTRGLGAGRPLEHIARACAEVTGARWATVSVRDLTGSWPAPADGRPQLTVPVEHGGELLGRIELGFPPGRSPTRAERRLLGEFALQAGLAFRNLALTAALRARADALARDADALAASRRQLQGAADAERARIAAAIRRDVLVHLSPVPADPDVARLQEMEDATTRAIQALRVITSGVRIRTKQATSGNHPDVPRDPGHHEAV